MSLRSCKKAFSMIELIFVIAILAIIGAVAVPKLLDSRNSAVISTIKQDVSTITTSVQSYYMLEGSISKITDAVNINENSWSVSDNKVEFSDNSKSCITIEVSGTQLKVVILENSTELCKEIYNEGVRSVTYELF
ncbi:MAG: type II secretion system protein [Campylobacterota bacterium]|nr:type II secretion system protein [Campylobacterota bacterium]